MSAALAAPSLPARFAAAIDLLCRGLTVSLPQHWDNAALALRAWTRLRRLLARFASLAATLQAGQVFASRRSAPGTARPRSEATAIRLPRGAGWLLTLAPALETRLGRAQVESLLGDPEFLALLAQAPQAGRILRPLFHALRIEMPPVLRMPRSPRGRLNTSGSAEAGANGGKTTPPRTAPPLPLWLTPPAPPPTPEGAPAAAPPRPARTGPPAS